MSYYDLDLFPFRGHKVARDEQEVGELDLVELVLEEWGRVKVC